MDECEVMWRVPADADAVTQFVGWDHPLPAVVLKPAELAAAARDAARQIV